MSKTFITTSSPSSKRHQRIFQVVALHGTVLVGEDSFSGKAVCHPQLLAPLRVTIRSPTQSLDISQYTSYSTHTISSTFKCLLQHSDTLTTDPSNASNPSYPIS